MPRDLVLRYNYRMKVNVPHVAKLANLTISPDEKPKLEKQLEEILTYFEKLKKVETSKVEETSQVTGLENITREDKVCSCELSQEEALSNAKSTEKGFIKVKAILENNDK